MAKLVAPGIQVQRQTTTASPEARINQYVQLLWVVAAGGLGIALLCGAASIGLADTNSSAAAALQSRGIVDMAIANVNTAQALTVEAFSGILPALTVLPSNSATFNPTFTITVTASFTPPVTASRTSISFSLTRTRRPGQGLLFPTSTQVFLPTFTRTSQPLPTITITLIPSATNTSSPVPTVITKTPKPTRTRTPTPPPTNTSEPAPTNTPIPPPSATDTSVPPSTDTSAPPPATDTSAPPPPPTDTSGPPPAPTDTSEPPATTTQP